MGVGDHMPKMATAALLCTHSRRTPSETVLLYCDSLCVRCGTVVVVHPQGTHGHPKSIDQSTLAKNFPIPQIRCLAKSDMFSDIRFSSLGVVWALGFTPPLHGLPRRARRFAPSRSRTTHRPIAVPALRPLYGLPGGECAWRLRREWMARTSDPLSSGAERGGRWEGTVVFRFTLCRVCCECGTDGLGAMIWSDGGLGNGLEGWAADDTCAVIAAACRRLCKRACMYVRTHAWLLGNRTAYRTRGAEERGIYGAETVQNWGSGTAQAAYFIGGVNL